MQQNYQCPNCGAELYWDASVGALKCQYCDYSYKPEDIYNQQNQNMTQNNNYVPETAIEGSVACDDSVSKDLVSYSCSNCGAEIVTARSTVATTCPYCDRAVSFNNKLVGNKIPQYVVPFKITNEEAQKIFKKYISRAIFSPKDILKRIKTEKVKGIFVPYWLYNASNDADLQIHCENTTSKRRGDDKVDTIRSYNVIMSVNGEFEKIPADALSHLDDDLMNHIEPFDYREITQFNSAYLSGYYTEEYDEDQNAVYQRILNKIDKATKDAVLNKVNYQSKVISSYQPHLSNVNGSYAMLPVWLFYANYNGKDYIYAINGQTGKVTGKIPISFGKVFLYSLLSILGSNIVMFLISLL